MSGTYGKAGADDTDVIDQYLAGLAEGAVVINLGCGPRVDQLANLSRMVGHYQFRSTLVFADRATFAELERINWVPGPANVSVVKVDAASASSTFGAEYADLILALGLFADVADVSPDGTREGAWLVVLHECFTVLKRGGHLLVSNSVDRQNMSEFSDAARSVGFDVAQPYVSEAVWGAEKPRDRRYLLVCSKPRL